MLHRSPELLIISSRIVDAFFQFPFSYSCTASISNPSPFTTFAALVWAEAAIVNVNATRTVSKFLTVNAVIFGFISFRFFGYVIINDHTKPE